jgi:lipopolysaccharide biosynthesis glycosyltransferase
MKTKKTCIVLATDIYFAEYTQVLLKSISANYNDKEKLDVVVLVSKEVLDREFKFIEFENLEISLRYPSQVEEHEASGLTSRMYKNANFTSASMYRYFMGNVCAEFDKAIYIDIDCIVARDIQPILDFELVNAPIAAFQEMHLEHPDNPYFRDCAYFNSGVMVVDLNRWREDKTEEKLIEVSESFTAWTGSQDQDILNVVFRNNWTPLNINFNYLTNIYPGLRISNPIIVHFAGKSKPWKATTADNAWKRLWNEYYRDNL